MKSIPQQLLISGTVLFLLGLLAGFATPVFRNPRMGVSAHATAMQSGMALWALGLMWQRLGLSASIQSLTAILAAIGLYATVIGLSLAALWGTSRATPLAGAGHQAAPTCELTVSALLAGGSLCVVVAVTLVLWGLLAWRP